MKVLFVVVLLSCFSATAFAQETELSDGEKLDAYLNEVQKKVQRPLPEVLEKKGNKKKVLKYKTAHGRIAIDANGVKTLDMRQTMDQRGKKIDEPIYHEFRGENAGLQMGGPDSVRWLEGVVRLDDDSFVVLTGVVASVVPMNPSDESPVRKTTVLEAIPVEVSEEGVGFGLAVYFEYSKVNWTGSHNDDFYISVEWPMESAADLPIYGNGSMTRHLGLLQLHNPGPLEIGFIHYGDKQSNTLNVVMVCNSRGPTQCDQIGFFDRKVQRLKDGKVIVGSGKKQLTCDLKMNECSP